MVRYRNASSETPSTEAFVRAVDLRLVRAAGGWINTDPTAPRGQRHTTDKLTADAIEVCRQTARRAKKPLAAMLRKLAAASLVDEIGRYHETGELDAGRVNHRIAEILGVPVTIGPTRVYPDGRIEILCCNVSRRHPRPEDRWELASDELLARLDAEIRLGVPEGSAHRGAEIVRAWRGEDSL